MCEACNESTINFTQFKDEQFVGSIEAIDQLMESFRSVYNVPGCALAVVEDDDIVYMKGYGFADVAAKRPFTVGTPSVVGSVAKTITALGLLALVEDGHLGLDDPINDHVPYPHDSLDGITVRQLLSHTSGITHNGPNFNTDEWPQDDEDLKDWWVDIEHPGVHPRLAYFTYYAHNDIDPGVADEGRYSSTNFTILGSIIDEITSSPGFEGPKGYEAFSWRKVGLPADILSLCLAAEWRMGDIHNLAKGYYKGVERPWPGFQWGWEGPAGGWTMTIGDLARLMIGINNDRIVSAATRQLMLSDAGGGDDDIIGQAVRFGLGFLLLGSGGTEAYCHHGDIAGYTARYTYYYSGVGVALLFNEEDVNKGAIGDLTDEIRDRFQAGAVAGMVLEDEDRRKQKTAVYRLVKNYEGHVRRLASLVSYRTKEPAQVFPAAARLLLRTEGERGRRMLRHYEEGDFEGAATLAMEMFESRRRPPVTLPDDRV